MSSLAKEYQESVTGEEVLRILPTFPATIAKELAPLLKTADIETYKHFLVTMYHYTHNAEPQLIHAMDQCTDPVMKEYFKEMAKEERGHHLLAKRDYEEFGCSVEDSIAPPSVKSFHDYWYGLGKENVNEFVGAMYVFENVAKAVGKDIRDMMSRLELTKRQSRWLLVHLEADIGHGDEAGEMCSRFINDNPAAMLMAAEVGAEEWMAVFRHAFSNKS